MKKILIIDEETLLIEPIIDRIEYDFEDTIYTHVTTGAEGLFQLKSVNFDVVILDMMLPLGEGIILPYEEPDLMYGLFILRQIRLINERIPVICYTVVHEEAVINQINQLNATHICKLGNNNFDLLFNNLNKIIQN